MRIDFLSMCTMHKCYEVSMKYVISARTAICTLVTSQTYRETYRETHNCRYGLHDLVEMYEDILDGEDIFERIGKINNSRLLWIKNRLFLSKAWHYETTKGMEN